VAVLALAGGAAAPSAQAAIPPSVFWSNYNDGAILRASLDGSGGSVLDTTGGPVGNSSGVAIDPAAGRIYWASRRGRVEGIGYANLDGSGSAGVLNTAGATLDGPSGVAIDPAAGRIYWANAGGVYKISFAKLDGSGSGGDLSTTGATVDAPQGVAIDKAAGRIYWSNDLGAEISFANLDGSGGSDLNTKGATISNPQGVALDVVGGRAYWANYGGNTISFANLDGSGGDDLNTTGATVSSPAGVAVDRAANRVYWTNYGGNTISFANLDNTGAGGDLVTTGATPDGPWGSPAIYTGAIKPTVSTEAASSVTLLGATLNGTANPQGNATTYHFDYGTTAAYGSRVPAADAAAGADNTSHALSQPVSGLLPNTTYHFRIVATNAAGPTEGADQIFTTSPLAPDASTLPASGVTQTGATLNGSVNPHGVAASYHFDYGTTTSYGTSTPTQSAGSASSSQTASAALSALAPNTLYHFRIVANGAGGNASGGDQTFVTPAPPGTPPATPPAGPASAALTLTNLTLSPASFGAAGTSTLLTGSASLLRGTTIRVTLNRPAMLRLRFHKLTTHPPRPGTTPPRALTRRGHAGRNAIRFDGRLGGSALTPGRWRVLVSATAGGRTTPVKTARFTILPG
jgi:DNA-binding beta-propeller fold protein YncE